MRGGGTTPVRFRDTTINLHLDVLKCKRLDVVYDSNLSISFIPVYTIACHQHIQLVGCLRTVELS